MMNPLRKRKKFTVLKQVEVKQPSGSIKKSWVEQEKPISVCIYDQSAQNQLTYGASGTRIKQYSYLGLTTTKTLTADNYRIKRDEVTYTIKGVNNEGRLAQLFMEVLTNG